ncbi:MAG: hypothetical protein MJE66_06750 [Proteobacteria bacterium]|nr:hypothetical protein [Pseudomonadota bacterium]
MSQSFDFVRALSQWFEGDLGRKSASLWLHPDLPAWMVGDWSVLRALLEAGVSLLGGAQPVSISVEPDPMSQRLGAVLVTISEGQVRARGPIPADDDQDDPLLEGARLLAAELRGRVWIDAEPGGGWQLSFTFQMDPVEEPDPELGPGVISARRFDLEQLRAAQAESDWERVKTLGRYLREAGRSLRHRELTERGRQIEKAGSHGRVGELGKSIDAFEDWIERTALGR